MTEPRRQGGGAAGAGVHAGVALVAAATLIEQVALTRIFSFVQWHHFAFMAVGLGLLGFGASGTALAVVPVLRGAPLPTAAWAALAVAPSVGLALLAVVTVPADAYLVALDPTQWLFLAVVVAALVLPFFFGGLVTGVLLAGFPHRASSLYAASFLGAAGGALAAVPLLETLGGPGCMIASGAAAAAGSAILWAASHRRAWAPKTLGAAALAVVTALGATLPVELPLSPYKSLSQLRRLPDARVVFSRENAISRVDVVRSAAVRSAPGLSHVFAGIPPSLPGLTIDGEGTRGLPVGTDATFTEYLPTAVAYHLRSGRALIVGMGVEVLGALHQGMGPVTILEANPLVAEAARRFGRGVLDAPGAPSQVRIVVEHPRTYLRRTRERFDVIQVPLLESFQVVASGAFSLAEHYLYTVEAMGAYLKCLAPGGVLAVTRWIQTPPSEEIRVWAAAVLALERSAPSGRGGMRATGPPDPASRLVALRSLNTMTVLVKPDGFAPADVAAVRAFAASRRFDITYAPGVEVEAANRYTVMPTDLHRAAFLAILDPVRRSAFLGGYPFDVRPARDGWPFFFHFFRWQQVPRILATLGRTWQPFGGGGYLVLVGLLAIVALLSAALILAPLRVVGVPATAATGPGGRSVFLYFLLLGLAFLFVEIPLLQQMILVLGSPTHAAAVVLAGLLVSSGAGSLLAPRVGRRLLPVAVALAAVVAAIAWTLPQILDAALGLATPGRLAVLAAVIGPSGILMGMPFPAGIALVGRFDPRLVPWAWGINGCASVLASILAAMLALEGGFRPVLLAGALAYAGAGLVAHRAGWSRGPGTSAWAPGATGAPAARTPRRPDW
ncbi:MAG: SAM-dependent methyltransferase [Armatimonadota bacterium]|nr:SAM-dependent methyltransferase [Armatimonadota bacterium]